MAAWFRILANPRVLKRFLGTKSGKKATLKYGSMLLNSRMAQNAIEKFINRNDDTMQNNKAYKQQKKEYIALQKRVARLEAQMDSVRDNNEKMSELTFALGRSVVEMQNLLLQMQLSYQSQINQIQIDAIKSNQR